ncbi:hypothetical protein BK009_03390 [Methanobacterium subterraneum]|uniref:Uncharacterized protein n=1 Tax=Methanobacterium subterraneum TaxID=59277 RepID=A0A2H4VNX4_9EURY|nr:hypothetical protein [Methanobacterium subterraneum]AUB59803.1 hypothetical protein BK009_03390 [Methanobacterium subterraneum]
MAVLSLKFGDDLNRGVLMGVEEEIFEEFFKKLDENVDFPKIVLNNLKSSFKTGNLDSKREILKTIKLGDSDED